MAGAIALIATLDTKGPEVKYLKDRIEQKGGTVRIVDTGMRGTPLAIQADISQLGDHRFRDDHPRMRQHGDAAQFVYEGDHLCRRRAGFGPVSRLAVANEAYKGFLFVHGSTGGDDSCGNVRATQGPAICARQHILQCDGYTQPIEAFDDGGTAFMPALT